MATHEAGALHAPGYGNVAFVPSWLRAPADAGELLPQLWASSVRREPSGELSVGGVGALEEVDRVAAAAGELGVRAGVLLRVTVGVEAHTHEYIATAHEDQKFGLSIAGGIAAEAARRTLARPELALLGLHSHIGSQ